jgi:2-polyprenyl-3-methyl-5-hydroxy-6-metoxy-1,4-benzoquinol methylase
VNTQDHEQLEAEYWGTCVNTFEEDQKHYVYAEIMELLRIYYNFDAGHRRILDIGGGPTSMLLKCKNLKAGLVVDPLAYPAWTQLRYAAHNIQVARQTGESYTGTGFDEVWIYNCLQHVEDPEQIIRNAVRAAPVLRLFEWTDIPPHPAPILL